MYFCRTFESISRMIDPGLSMAPPSPIFPKIHLSKEEIEQKQGNTKKMKKVEKVNWICIDIFDFLV